MQVTSKMTPRRPTRAKSLLLAAIVLARSGLLLRADDPKPNPANTIHVELSPPVTPESFARAVHFFVAEVVDRSGNPQPMLLMKSRGGLFVDRQPTEIVRNSIIESLRAANLLANNESEADVVLEPYLFHFGLENGSSMDYFGKVEFAVTVKDAKTGDSKQVSANGTSIAGRGFRKKTIAKNMKEDMDAALEDAVTNLLRGTQLRDAVNSFGVRVEPAAPSPAAMSEAVSPAAAAPPLVNPVAASARPPNVASAAAVAPKHFDWLIKTTEAKHFTRAEGVELSPAFTEYLYAEIRSELVKQKHFGQVIGEGETVNELLLDHSVVVDGVLTEYKKGNRVTDGLIGFGAGARSLKMEITMARRSDNRSVAHIEVRVRLTPRMSEQVMARMAAKEIAEGLWKYRERASDGS
jgi:Domain of unknown function (DUF4410)